MILYIYLVLFVINFILTKIFWHKGVKERFNEMYDGICYELLFIHFVFTPILYPLIIVIAILFFIFFIFGILFQFLGFTEEE